MRESDRPRSIGLPFLRLSRGDPRELGGSPWLLNALSHALLNAFRCCLALGIGRVQNSPGDAADGE